MGQVPRCAACEHAPLTLLAFSDSQIVRARLGCVCRNTILYTHEEERRARNASQSLLKQNSLQLGSAHCSSIQTRRAFNSRSSTERG